MKNKISAIVFGSTLVFGGIAGSIISGYNLKKETNPTSRTGLLQVFFTSIGAILLGVFMLAFGIFGDG